jgi:outer membrane protein assembly factor BamB
MAQVDRLDAADDDVLDLRSGRAPRWVTALASVAVVALVLGLIAHQRNGGRPPAPALPSPTVSPVARTVPHTAMTFIGSTFVALVDGRLRAQDVRTGRVLGSAPAPDPGSAGSVQLLAEPSGGLLWVVTVNSVPTRVRVYALPGLRLVRRVTWTTLAVSAAALAGHLYLSTSVGVADLAPGDVVPRPVVGLYGAVGPLVADPARHRIIAADFGFPTEIWSYRPGTGARQASSSLPISDGTLAVADGRVWIAGGRGARPALWRLDPVSLRPVSRSPLPASVGARAVLVGTGAATVWVRPAADLNLLLCADAGRGVVVQSWRVGGAVASSRGIAYADTPEGPRPLTLISCSG